MTTRSPSPQVARFGADFSDDSHGFVAEDVPGFHEGAENFVEMQVGSADVRRRDFDDGVGGLFDLRVGHRLHAHVAPAVPGDSFHEWLATRVARVETGNTRW